MAELPDLLAVLSVRLGPIGRVIYKLTDWAPAPAKCEFGNQVVRLDGYRLQPVNTIEVVGTNRKRIVLLVLSPETDPAQAHAVMMTAAGPNNGLTVESLLMISAKEIEART